MKLLVHNTIKTSQPIKKVIYYIGNNYRHLIIFDKTIEHSLVIRKLLSHFKLNDNNCQAGLLEKNRIVFYKDFEEFYNLKDLAL